MPTAFDNLPVTETIASTTKLQPDEAAKLGILVWLDEVRNGIVQADPEQLKAAELELKVRGLLVNKSVTEKHVLSIDGTLKDWLDKFSQSPRLLHNTTVKKDER